MSDVFVDRFMKFNVSQGVVRLDFARIEDIDSEKNEVTMSPATRLVMPMDGFMHFIDQAVKLRSGIIEQAKTAPASKNTEDKASQSKAKAKSTAKSKAKTDKE